MDQNSACGQRSHWCPGPRPDRFLFDIFDDGLAVRSSAAVFPAPFTMQGTIDGCFMTPCIRARGSPGRHCSSGPRQLRFGGAPVPGLLVPSPLASWTTKLTTADVVKSVSSIQRRHAGHDGEVCLWPSGPHRETKKKNKLPWLWLGYLPLLFLSDDMTLGRLAVRSQ